jgi:hypothetical protein
MDGIVVSHPTKQGNVYERPVAAQGTGRAVRFLTGLYGEKLPFYLARLGDGSGRARQTLERLRAKRRHALLDPANVRSVSWAWLEIAKLYLGRNGPRFSPWMDRLGSVQDNLHDRSAARWLRSERNRAGFGIFTDFKAPAANPCGRRNVRA